jgi:integrase
MSHVLLVLAQLGRVAPRETDAPTATDAILASFEVHLRQTRGFTGPTSSQYSRLVRKFLEQEGVLDPAGIARVRPIDVMSFVASCAAHVKPGSAKVVATALRSFLRFQQMLGLCDPRLAESVPAIPEWSLSRLPKTLTDGQVRGLLASFDRATGTGRRDYAIALCLVRLALRAGEVAELSLDDIDWRAGTLQIPVGKARRASVLPLPSPVGRAIIAYVRGGRPTTRERRVFVRHGFPVGTAIRAGSVSAVIRRGFERSGESVLSMGTHAIRHTAATRMIQSGATIKEVADVLRHRSIDTTMIYTKVDLPRLTAVALPFPKVRP